MVNLLPPDGNSKPPEKVATPNVSADASPKANDKPNLRQVVDSQNPPSQPNRDARVVRPETDSALLASRALQIQTATSARQAPSTGGTRLDMGAILSDPRNADTMSRLMAANLGSVDANDPILRDDFDPFSDEDDTAENDLIAFNFPNPRGLARALQQG